MSWLFVLLICAYVVDHSGLPIAAVAAIIVAEETGLWPSGVLMIVCLIFVGIVWDMLMYYVGDKVTVYIGDSHVRGLSGERFIKRYGGVAVAMGRFVPGVGKYVSVMCRVMGMEFKAYCIGVIIGNVMYVLFAWIVACWMKEWVVRSTRLVEDNHYVTIAVVSLVAAVVIWQVSRIRHCGIIKKGSLSRPPSDGQEK